MSILSILETSTRLVSVGGCECKGRHTHGFVLDGKCTEGLRNIMINQRRTNLIGPRALPCASGCLALKIIQVQPSGEGEN